jgi:glycosyltransferase involved in cell wall biosynthesis
MGSVNPLNVLIASRSFDFAGGVANYVRRLIEHMDGLPVSYTHVSVSKAEVKSSSWRRPFEYLDSIVRFGRTILDVRPDVIHLNPSLNHRSLPLHLCLVLVAKALGQSVFLYYHGWDDRVALAMMNGTWMGRLLGGILRRADYSAVLSARFRNQLIQAGWNPSDVRVLPLMIDLSAYSEPAKDGRNKSAIDGCFRMLFLSRLARDKGVWELMEAVEWLRQSHPDMHFELTCAGEGSEHGALSTYVRDGGLGDVVHLPGYVRGEAKYEAFHRADVFVFPSSHDEGFPFVVIESLAAGLPMIYTPVGALAEILGPENGIRIELDAVSGTSVGREVWTLYQDPDRRQAMAAANRQKAQQFDVEVVCAQMVEIYRQVANKE